MSWRCGENGGSYFEASMVWIGNECHMTSVCSTAGRRQFHGEVEGTKKIFVAIELYQTLKTY